MIEPGTLVAIGVLLIGWGVVRLIILSASKPPAPRVTILVWSNSIWCYKTDAVEYAKRFGYNFREMVVPHSYRWGVTEYINTHLK